MKKVNSIMTSVNVLGIPLYNLGLQQAVESVQDICRSAKEKKSRCISATGAHGLVHAQKHKEFASILHQFFFNLPDGMPGVWVGRLKGAHEMQRCYGPDFFRDIMIATRDKPVRHYLCGGKEGVADELQTACAKKFGNHNIVGTFCPPFRDLTDDEYRLLADDINAKNTDILWIGISTPKQEAFAYRLSKYVDVHFVASVGAAFDFHIGKVKQAPRLLQKIGMEWFFRLCMEPKRLYRRYLEIVPLFVFYNIKELIKYTFTATAKEIK